MWASLRNGVVNLSTASKLLAGFGLVLLLTALVALTGLLALREVGRGTTLQQQVGAIAEQVLRMRQSEQAYAATGDKQHADGLAKQADEIRQSVTELASKLVGDGTEALNGVPPALDEYQKAFARYVDLTDGMQLSLQAADWLVVGASNSLDLLQDGLSEDGIDQLKQGEADAGSKGVGQALQIGKIHQLMLEALGQARQRLEQSRSTGSVDASPIAQAADAQKLARSLADSLNDPGYASVLNEVALNIDSFNSRLKDYGDSLQQQKTEYQHLLEQAEGILTLVARAQDAVQAHMRTMQHASSALILIAAALALVLGVLAALCISLLIVRPLKQVIAQARAIADGDLSVRGEVRRRDEIGQLLSAIQDMAGNLRGMVGRLQHGVTQLSSSAQSLSAVTEQTRQGVNGQKQETDQVATAIAQMAATVHEVARNAEAAATSTGQADARVASGSEVVRQTLQRIERLAVAMKEATSSIERLSQDTQRIDAVLDVIKSVAEQTNLLALNAAIEAARAGEQGRGFAVVADEVRALAKRTQQSTAQIEELIVTLREGARRAVNDMGQSAELVAGTVSDANQTEVALGAIAEAVALISGMNQQIASAAEEQSAVAEEINRSITSIRDIADQSAEAMEQTAASSTELADLSRELQTLAGQFRF